MIINNAFTPKQHEKAAFAFLKRYKNPSRRKKANSTFWDKYELLYGKNFVRDLLLQMKNDDIIEVINDKKTVLSKRGKEMYKRGWVYFENHWYDDDRIKKYTIYISILALIIAIIGNNNIVAFFKFLWHVIQSGLCRTQ